MRKLSEHLNEALSKSNNANHDAGVKALLANGFERGKNDTVTRDGVTYVVRAHRMPETHVGKAIIVDFMDAANDGCNNMIFIDPNEGNRTICLVDRKKLAEFIQKYGNNRKVMWITDRKDDPQNYGKSSCMTIPIKSMEGQDWFKIEEI